LTLRNLFSKIILIYTETTCVLLMKKEYELALKGEIEELVEKDA